ncbi:hypothetical protein PPYR_04413 [Photinus pyralis]|uniref:Serpin domain-containing protein n=2 Tax=Photinus pyralis TaxID=7054 RepID=A0A1Y1NAX6_PHOPY|nr:serpin B8-like isoform X2 [Photinus pyralis]XP_031334681.1 serpin B8-like isoform X2 [Photinus pyralis]KAB0802227.1 hypothetical protein PPYR_04413 [Photinus pyralis]
MYILPTLCLALIIWCARASKLIDDFHDANSKFTAEGYKIIRRLNLTSNFLFCPLSAQIVVALIRAGANGTTADELALHIHNPKTKQLFSKVLSSIKSKQKCEFKMATNLYISDKYHVKKQFKNFSKKVFRATTEVVNFNETKKVINYINDWVANQTKHNIKEIVSSPDIHKGTEIIAVNGLYFNGDWLYPFDPTFTDRIRFHVNNNKSILINMMRSENKFKYRKDAVLKAQFLELPFYDQDVIMTFILPTTRFGLDKIEENISDYLPHRRSLNYHAVSVTIPIFKVECNIDLVAILKNMGVRTPFSIGADFSRMSDTTPSPVVGNIIQKTFLEINEKGATAAASTAVVIEGRNVPPRNIFLANKPFLYYLWHKKVGIFFIGRYTSPKE